MTRCAANTGGHRALAVERVAGSGSVRFQCACGHALTTPTVDPDDPPAGWHRASWEPAAAAAGHLGLVWGGRPPPLATRVFAEQLTTGVRDLGLDVRVFLDTLRRRLGQLSLSKDARRRALLYSLAGSLVKTAGTAIIYAEVAAIQDELPKPATKAKLAVVDEIADDLFRMCERDLGDAERVSDRTAGARHEPHVDDYHPVYPELGT